VEASINGIFLDGDSNYNIIENKEVFESRGVDIKIGYGLALEANENAFLDNDCDKSLPDRLFSI